MNQLNTHHNTIANSHPPFYFIEHRTASEYHNVGEREAVRLHQIEIGSDPRCDIRFEDTLASVSRRHAAIVREADNWKLIRISRIKPTLANGHSVSKQWYLQHGDEIQLSVDGPRMAFILPPQEEPIVVPPIRESKLEQEPINVHERQLAAPFRRISLILAGALIALIAAFAIWAVADQNRSESYMDEARGEAANVRQSLQSISSELNEVRTGLDEVRRQQDELARLIHISDEALSKWLRNDMRDLRSRIAESENRLTNDLGLMRRSAPSPQSQRLRAAPSPRNIPPKPAAPKTDVAEETAGKQAAPSPFAPCFPYIYYIRLDKIEMFGAKNEFSVFNTTKTSWAGTGFMLDDGRFVTARSLVERWKFREYKELSALNALTEKGGRVIAYFTATSPSGNSFTFTGSLFIVDKSTDAFDIAMKQSFASASPEKDIAYLQMKANGGLSFGPSAALDKDLRLEAYGFPSQIGLSPDDALASGGDGFLQVGSGSPVFALNNAGKPVAVGMLVVSHADGQRRVVPLPQQK
ncbi:MAG: FHA domain-containing protein [Tannerellaceae bacterium]|jgi:uncharacterized membrane-anchored protein YhcB (DUF1043 family)|nr:FHA domain-containing protein [Tannerellaceae bacterium]